jgi:hypothetical protein
VGPGEELHRSIEGTGPDIGHSYHSSLHGLGLAGQQLP